MLAEPDLALVGLESELADQVSREALSSHSDITFLSFVFYKLTNLLISGNRALPLSAAHNSHN
ncbi:hypothetical protein D3C78_1248560 [compost metagenome]